LELLQTIPGGGVVFTLIAFVVALSVIVAVHEYGHYIVGRWCGIHAEVFSLGFGPRLFGWTDRRGTRWQLAAIPFGGYVKFLGDADAASGRDSALMARMDPSGVERTMHGARLWKRSATVVAGPVFNFILTIAIFAGIILVQGQATEAPTIGSLKPMPQEWTGGPQPGDRIVAIEGQEINDYEALYSFLDEFPEPRPLTYTVEADGSLRDVTGPFGFPPIVDSLQPQSAAMAAKLVVGDIVVAIDGVPISAFRELRETVRESDGKPLELTVWRAGQTVSATLEPKRTDLPGPDGGFETHWLIGVTGGLFFTPETENVGPVRAVVYGFQQMTRVIENSLSGIYHIVIGAISSCNLQGPIGIAQISGQAASQGTVNFIWLIAVLSTAVGMLNLFPIPILDGGHLVFHAYEAVTGRPPNDRILNLMMTTGLAIILTFMVFALSTDLFCP
jgi:regulator of sigma E protease